MRILLEAFLNYWQICSPPPRSGRLPRILWTFFHLPIRMQLLKWKEEETNMFCPVTRSREERHQLLDEIQKDHDRFVNEHPFLSTFFGTVSVLAQLAFWIIGLFIVVLFLFWLPEPFLIFFNLPLELPHDRVTSKHLKIYSSSLKRPRLYQLKPERRYSPLRNLSGFRFSFVGLSCLLCLLLRSLKREKYMAAAVSRPVACLYRESSYIGTDFVFITGVPQVPVSVFLCCQSKRSATRGFFGVSFFSMSSHKDWVQSFGQRRKSERASFSAL